MFEITIREITEKKVTKRGEHTIIDRVPWSNEALEKKGMFQSTEEFLKENPTQPVYGYAPSFEGVEKVEREVLKQCVDELNLATVIKAINNL